MQMISAAMAMVSPRGRFFRFLFEPIDATKGVVSAPAQEVYVLPETVTAIGSGHIDGTTVVRITAASGTFTLRRPPGWEWFVKAVVKPQSETERTRERLALQDVEQRRLAAAAAGLIRLGNHEGADGPLGKAGLVRYLDTALPFPDGSGGEGGVPEPWAPRWAVAISDSLWAQGVSDSAREGRLLFLKEHRLERERELALLGLAGADR